MCSSIIRSFADKLCIEGIFTHLCVADSLSEDNKHFTINQIEKFKIVSNLVADLHLSYIHCFNSAGGLYYLNEGDSFCGIDKIVRLGIVLYGLKPDRNNVLSAGITPAMTWKSAISMVKEVRAEESVGYGRACIADHDMRTATVTTGYADGLNRLLSNRGFMMVNGKKTPIVGQICMDQIMIDVTDIPEVEMGSEVIILGQSGDVVYTADDMVNDLGTIGYEVLCNISKRVQRFYKTHGLLYAL